MASFGATWMQGLASTLIGVIDLQGGQAVHGVAGNRDHYLPTERFFPPDGESIAIEGDARRLAEEYQNIGMRSLYVADLDGIRNNRWQTERIGQIIDVLRDDITLLIDLGMRHPMTAQDWSWIESVSATHPNVRFVVATETVRSLSLLSELILCVGRERVAVSFDYMRSTWLSRWASETQWIATCVQRQVRTVIGLDLAAVGGTSVSATETLCHRLRPLLPDARFITGGGIRSESDARQLVEAGADGLLVASWFAR